MPPIPPEDRWYNQPDAYEGVSDEEKKDMFIQMEGASKEGIEMWNAIAEESIDDEAPIKSPPDINADNN